MLGTYYRVNLVHTYAYSWENVKVLELRVVTPPYDQFRTFKSKLFFEQLQ